MTTFGSLLWSLFLCYILYIIWWYYIYIYIWFPPPVVPSFRGLLILWRRASLAKIIYVLGEMLCNCVAVRRDSSQKHSNHYMSFWFLSFSIKNHQNHYMFLYFLSFSCSKPSKPLSFLVFPVFFDEKSPKPLYLLVIPVFLSFSTIGGRKLHSPAIAASPMAEKLEKTGITRKYNGLEGFGDEEERKHKKI